MGPSGSGKSSVVLAGLVPRLMAGAIEGSERWPVAILRPGDDPLKSLTEKVVPLLRKEVRPDPSVSESREQRSSSRTFVPTKGILPPNSTAMSA